MVTSTYNDIKQSPMLTVNIIGAGRLGRAIGLALASKNLAQIAGIYNQSIESAQCAAHHIGAGVAVASIEQLPEADIFLLCCNDDNIANLTRALSKQTLSPKTIVMHCSGVLSSAVFSPLRKKGVDAASLHPLRAFTNQASADSFQGCYCSLEGDAAACAILKKIFQALGAVIMNVGREQKSQYHAAAVIASNYLVTLAHCSQALLEHIGIAPLASQHITQDLMQCSLDNLRNTTVERALTGPVQRGDTDCITQHLAALAMFPAIDALYRSAALCTLPLAKLDTEKSALLQHLLQLKDSNDANK